MFDSRSPWYSGGHSRTDLNAGSSASLLHSIYGSQASQLPFSEYGESEADLLTTKSDYLPPNLRSSSPALPQRRLARPKSSPASVIDARERQRRQIAGDGYGAGAGASYGQEATTRARRPVSAMPRQRPGTASGSRGRPRLARGRPGSAAGGRPGSAAGGRPQRPSSAAPSHFLGGGGASPKRSRPRTAMGIRSGSSTMLLDLEEEEEEDEDAPIIRDTPPVHLTRTPEYFNFWEGKPLLQRDYGVKVHKRKAWRRPKSDYGSGLISRRKRDGEDDDGLGGGLETLHERDDGSTLGSDTGTRRGSRDFGGLGQGGGAGDNDASKLSISGEGLNSGSGSRRGSKDFGGKGRGKDDRWRGYGDGRNKGSRNLNKSDKSDWDKGDGTAYADEDDYFKKKALKAASWMDDDGSGSAHTTRFELPMDMKTLEGMSPLEYLRKHCIISKRRMAHCNKIFLKQDKDKDAQINREELVSGLTEAHHNLISADQANSVLELVEMSEGAHVDGKLFAGLCCLTERALNLNYLPLARREVIEVVDFEALDWKLRGCHISTSLRTLFTQL